MANKRPAYLIIKALLLKGENCTRRVTKVHHVLKSILVDQIVKVVFEVQLIGVKFFDRKVRFFIFEFFDDLCDCFTRTIDASNIGKDQIDVVWKNVSTFGLS